MDPWEIVSIVFITLISVGLIMFGSANYFKIDGSTVFKIVGGLFFSITNFIPLGLITFGLIADLIGQEFRYIVGSIVGFSSIVLSWLLSSFLTDGVASFSGKESSSGAAWCMLPGLEMLESKYLPMNLVSSSSILIYYLIFAIQNRDLSQNMSLIVGFPVLLIIQLISFYLGGCDTYYYGGLKTKILALLFGSVIGSLGWFIVSRFFPMTGPFLNILGKGSESTSGQSGYHSTASGYSNSTKGPQCSQESTEKGDEFVVQAYKNGVLVEDISK
jgi:hypothetical protein